MSTKIYNAYVYDGEVKDVLSFLKTFSDNFMERREEFIKTLIERDIQAHIQRLLLKSKGNIAQLGSLAQNEPIKYIFSPESFSYEYRENSDQAVVLYDSSNTVLGGKPLVQLFLINNSAIEKAITSNPKFSEFEFTNSIDMPDLKRAEVKKRKKVWDTIFKDSSTPSEAGVSYEMYDFIKDFKSNPSTFETSIKKVAQECYEKFLGEDNPKMKEVIISIDNNIRMARHEKENPSTDDDYKISEVMRMMSQIEKDRTNGVPMNAEDKDVFDKIVIATKFLPEDMSNAALKSIFDRMDTVIKKTDESNEQRAKRMKDYGYEEPVMKPAIKL